MNIFKFVKRSVLVKMGILMVLFLITIAFSISGTVVQLHKSEDDTLVINVAGRQRMLTQKMTKYALIIQSGDTDVINSLQGASNLFDASLQDLITGNDELGLPSASSEAGVVLQIVSDAWRPFEEKLQIMTHL